MKAVASTAVKSAQVTMLGRFSITVDGRSVSNEINRTHKLWNVLAYLVTHRGRMVSQAEFIDQFWPEDSGVAPANALKTQLYRIRTLLAPLFGEDFQAILSQRGGYEWNPAIQTTVDTDQFELLCQMANRANLPKSKRDEALKEAIQLYRGDFLPKLSQNLWVIPIGAKLHNLYLDAVISYANSLEEDSLYNEAVELAQKATAIEPLSESLHTVIVSGLVRQGKYAAALAHYEYATDMLYRTLGIKQWKALRELYDQIMATEQTFEADLGVIQSDLRETAQVSGAFFCEYGFFREIYRLEARRCQRNGVRIHIALITVSNPDGSLPPLKQINRTMDQLQAIIAQTLRSGDVVSRYSGVQYVIMLPCENIKDSEVAIGRIIAKYRRNHRVNRLNISFRIREIELCSEISGSN